MAGDDRIDGEADKDCYDAGGLGVTAYGGSGDDACAAASAGTA